MLSSMTGREKVAETVAAARRTDDLSPRELPGHDRHAERVLGRARRRDHAAVPHRAGGGHVQSGHVPARPRPDASGVARGLRRAGDPAGRRALRREPVPLPALLPVPGDPQAGPGGCPRPVLRLARSARDRPPEARHPARRGRLGTADARRLGPRLGGLVRRDGGDPVPRTSSSSAGSTSR